LRGKTAIGLPDVTQNRSDAAEYQPLPEQSSKIADAASPEATNLALPHQSFARGSHQKALSISGVTWKWHVLNRAEMRDLVADPLVGLVEGQEHAAGLTTGMDHLQSHSLAWIYERALRDGCLDALERILSAQFTGYARRRGRGGRVDRRMGWATKCGEHVAEGGR